MSGPDGLVVWVEEAMAPVGLVTSRAMMGGRTLYCDGVVFAITAHDQLWLKADAASDAKWDAAGCERFAFEMRDGKVATMSYRRAPDDCYDDPDALRRWAMLAMEAGRRAPVKKRKVRA